MALALLAAIPDVWSLSYYSLLRVIVTVSAVEAAWFASQRNSHAWVLVFASVAILWNPLFEVHFPKDTWMALDGTAAILFVVSVNKLGAVTLLPRGKGPLPLAYGWLLFLAYGMPMLVIFGSALARKSFGELSDQFWQGFMVLVVLLIVSVKAAYIQHALRSETVKFRVAWSLFLLVFTVWGELLYYNLHIRNPPAPRLQP